jgi:microcin C transport system substrate-binding protein
MTRRRVLVLLVLAACAAGAVYGFRPRPAPPEAAYDAEAAWKTLGMPMSREAFERASSGLRGVTLDRPPAVGSDYHPVFPPDQPYDPREWTTNKPGPSVASPDAKPGGTLRLSMESYPPTIRTEGPNSRLSTLYDIHSLIYESLLSYDMTIGDYIPQLADGWQILPDKTTYRFHVNPRARWADGSPVTADDVVATFEHLRRADRKDPETAKQWDEYLASVRMIDRHIVEFHARKPFWRIMLMISGQPIYPAAYIRMPGDVYLNEWNWKLPPGSGPYELRPADLVKGESITVRRRHDYWDEDDPTLRGMYNFDAIRWDVIRDEELTYQKFLAGEIDAYMVMRAQRWVDELGRERPVAMGWIQRRKIWELEPQGYGGFAFNMRQPPFDNRDVREAMALLFNRELLFAKFFFYQYDYMDSYFPGQVYARPGAHPVHYDPDAARALLARAGWTHRDSAGNLVDDRGRRFPTLELPNSSPSFERIFEVVKNDLWQQAGIRMRIVTLDSPSLLKKVWDNQFQLVFWNWTADLFPDMEFQFGSKYARMPQSNNINGFDDPRADRILAQYKVEFDQKKRIALMQQLDGILFDAHPYALSWFAPYYRIVWWDKFGYPPEYGDRYVGSLNNVIRYWWFDDARWRKTQASKARNLPNYPDSPDHQAEPIDQKWWLTHPLPMHATDETKGAAGQP